MSHSTLVDQQITALKHRIPPTPAQILGSDLISEYTAEDAIVTSSPDIDSIPAIAPGQDSGSLSIINATQKPKILDIGGVQFADFPLISTGQRLQHFSQIPTLYPSNQGTLCMWVSYRNQLYSVGDRVVCRAHGFAKGMALTAGTTGMKAELNWNFTYFATYVATPTDVNVWMVLYDATDLTLWQNNVLRATNSAHSGEIPNEVGDDVSWSDGSLRVDGSIRRHVTSLGVPTSLQRAQMQTYMAADAGI